MKFRLNWRECALRNALVALLWSASAIVLAQNVTAPDRRFSDRASWVQLELPLRWQGPRYALTSRAGPDAAARQPGAAYWLSFDYLPEAAEQPRQPLLRISVFPRATWLKMGVDAPQADLQVQTDTRVYVGMLAKDNPYATGSDDAKRFDAMRFTPESLFDAFSIIGDAEGAKVRSATVAKAPPRDRSLAAARLVCSGREPGWTLAINKGSNARLTLAEGKGGVAEGKAEKSGSKAVANASQAMKGRMEFADNQIVWRGRAGKAGDWVAVMHEDSCEVTPQGQGSHAILLSRPNGRVLQGCCQIAK